MKHTIKLITAVVFLLVGCNNTNTPTSAHITPKAIPVGKWKIVEVAAKNNKAVLPVENIAYNVFFNKDRSVIVHAEDNELSGVCEQIKADSLAFRLGVKTDVCCDTELAKTIFKAFQSTVKYEMNADTLSIVFSNEDETATLYLTPSKDDEE